MSDAHPNVTKGTDLSQAGAQHLDGEQLQQIQRTFHEQNAHSRGQDKQRDQNGRYMQSFAGRVRDVTNPEKELDEAVDRAMRGDDSVPDEITKAVKGTTSGKPTGTADKPDSTGEKTPEEKSAAGHKRDLESALKALRLDGFDDADLEDMSEERLVALGKKAAKRQADVSKRLEAASKQQTAKQPAVGDDDPAGDEDDEPASATKSAKAQAKSSPADQDDDDDELVSRIVPTVKELNELYGEEEFGRPLAKTLARVLKGPVARVAQLEAQIEQLVMDGARANLRERFPQVEQEEHHEALLEKMQALGKSGAYSNVRSLMHDAAMTLWGEQMIEKARHGAERKTRSAPAPLPQQRAASAKPMRFEDRLDAAVEAAMRTGDGDAVSRAFERR